MSDQPDHELEVLEEDQTVPPRPEEAIADVDRSRGDDGAPASYGDDTSAERERAGDGAPEQLK
jgi:hypothetical protein